MYMYNKIININKIIYKIQSYFDQIKVKKNELINNNIITLIITCY